MKEAKALVTMVEVDMLCGYKQDIAMQIGILKQLLPLQWTPIFVFLLLVEEIVQLFLDLRLEYVFRAIERGFDIVRVAG